MARMPSWDVRASNPNWETPSRLGISKIKRTEHLYNHRICMVHHVIYHILLFHVISEPLISQRDESWHVIPLLRERVKQALPDRSLAQCVCP